jgi:hypothetical protein
MVESATARSGSELPSVGPGGPRCHADGSFRLAEEPKRLPDVRRCLSETSSCLSEVLRRLAMRPGCQRATFLRRSELIRLQPNTSPLVAKLIRLRPQAGISTPHRVSCLSCIRVGAGLPRPGGVHHRSRRSIGSPFPTYSNSLSRAFADRGRERRSSSTT